MKMITTNIIRFDEMGIYVTSIDGRAYYSPMNGRNRPTLDKDGCIEWLPFEEVSEELDTIFRNNLGSYKSCYTNSNAKNAIK
jgi:hypothetical protein